MRERGSPMTQEAHAGHRRVCVPVQTDAKLRAAALSTARLGTQSGTQQTPNSSRYNSQGKT